MSARVGSSRPSSLSTLRRSSTVGLNRSSHTAPAGIGSFSPVGAPLSPPFCCWYAFSMRRFPVRPEHFRPAAVPAPRLENATDQVNEFQVWKAAGKIRTRPHSAHIDLLRDRSKAFFLHCTASAGLIGYSDVMDATAHAIPVFSDVVDAAARLQGTAVTTPLVYSPVLSDRARAKVFLKLETL